MDSTLSDDRNAHLHVLKKLLIQREIIFELLVTLVTLVFCGHKTLVQVKDYLVGFGQVSLLNALIIFNWFTIIVNSLVNTSTVFLIIKKCETFQKHSVFFD
ncbi:hypothetical protein BpHYR1_045574 [Brachionus plicatilis]|uniref:Uncharacterized protein n=1 Tax=Brachionus plicatilis TaxID=10195 RepID=A0A3M7QM53_BRAPC|nr:hypothetical protein BpHYR1_045574 [Brachionus plicatilis]